MLGTSFCHDTRCPHVTDVVNGNQELPIHDCILSVHSVVDQLQHVDLAV